MSIDSSKTYFLAIKDKVRIKFLSKCKGEVHLVEIVKGASTAFVLKIAGSGAQFIFSISLARLFGAEGTGIYFMALTVASVGAVFGRFGMDNALLKFVALNNSKREWVAVKGVFGKAILLSVCLSLLVTISIFVMAPWLANEIFSKPDLVLPIRLMSLTILPMSLNLLQSEALKGLKRIRDATLVQSVIVPVTSTFILYFIHDRYLIYGAIWAYIIGVSVSAFSANLLWRKAIPQLKKISGIFEISKLINTSVPLFWIALLNMVMTWMSTFALGVWASSADIGIFGVALRTTTLISFIAIAIDVIAGPKFAELHGLKNRTALRSVAINSARIMLVLAGPLTLFCLFFPSAIMSFFGDEFGRGHLLLTILAFGQLINAITGPVGVLLIMTGHEMQLRNIFIFTVILCVILNFTLVPILGVLGASIATSICLAFNNLAACFYVKKKLGFWSLPFHRLEGSISHESVH